MIEIILKPDTKIDLHLERIESDNIVRMVTGIDAMEARQGSETDKHIDFLLEISCSLETRKDKARGEYELADFRLSKSRKPSQITIERTYSIVICDRDGNDRCLSVHL